jgi:hypothetical protein
VAISPVGLFSDKETIVLKRLLLCGFLALAVAAPAGAGGWKHLKVRGVVVSASEEVVVVENLVGDAILKCRVPERLAEKAASFQAGDKVRMFCFRKRGQRAVLHKLERLGENARKGEKGQDEKGERKPEPKPEPKPERSKAEESAARGSVAELAPNAIVVVDAESGRRPACKVSAEKAHKLQGVKVGDRVKMLCLNGELAYLERFVEESKLYGTISALSNTSVSVTGDGRTLTCAVPGAFAEKLARFAVGESVKMMCRGTELTYLEKA